MTTLRSVETEQAAPHLVIAAEQRWLSIKLRELWEYRELLWFLTLRDVTIRYKQTVLGAGWAIIQPFTAMVIFSIVFGRLAGLPSEGVPYPIFSYTALLPWNLFAGALGRTTQSVVGSGSLITKVYFPRLIVPVASTLAPLVDFAVASIILFGMMAFYGILPTWRILTLPLFILLALATALGVGLWSSTLNVKYRDVGYIMPFVIQIWLYASPVAYSATLVPEQWRWLYGLNPMVGVIEGFRWALLGTEWDVGPVVLLSLVVVIVILVTGVIYFQRMEETFADVV